MLRSLTPFDNNDDSNGGGNNSKNDKQLFEIISKLKSIIYCFDDISFKDKAVLPDSVSTSGKTSSADTETSVKKRLRVINTIMIPVYFKIFTLFSLTPH